MFILCVSKFTELILFRKSVGMMKRFFLKLWISIFIWMYQWTAEWLFEKEKKNKNKWLTNQSDTNLRMQKMGIYQINEMCHCVFCVHLIFPFFLVFVVVFV